MAYIDFFGSKRLTITDFTNGEITAIGNIVTPLLASLRVNPKGIELNSRPSTWNIHKSQLYICVVATKGINAPVFADVAAFSKLLSGLDYLYQRTDADWDRDRPVETQQSIMIKQAMSSINDIIAPKTFSYLDETVFNKHTDIKNKVELLSNTLSSVSQSYQRQIVLDKLDGFNGIGLDALIAPVAVAIGLAFPPIAPFVAVFNGLVSLIQEFSKPDPVKVATDKFSLYKQYQTAISTETDELIAYKNRINEDGYDYDFVNAEIIKFVPKGSIGNKTPSTFTAKPNKDGTITITGIVSGDIVNIDGVAEKAATSNIFTSTPQKDGIHKVTVTGGDIYSYSETANVTTKAELFSAPLTFIQNNAFVVLVVVGLLTITFIVLRRKGII